MKKTKILATFGPAVNNPATIARLVNAGVNAFRINCSHGNPADFIGAAATIYKGIAKAKYPVGLLVDISGPKLRLDRFTGELKVQRGGELVLTSGKSNLAHGVVGVNHPAIIKSVKKGERVFIDDGNIGFEVQSTSRNELAVRALNPGMILPGKGINLPDSALPIPTITPKDRDDIRTAVSLDADYIALSFVRSGEDIKTARSLINRIGGRQKIIAKLEKREAIAVLDEIMELADGVMVARGDLGVELPPAELPTLQKRIIALANHHHKPVIVATQMLESMRFSPRATRAEINDVASAVFDFADAVMLSAETATGKYPEEAVKTMAAVIDATEPSSEAPSHGATYAKSGSVIPYAIAESVSRSHNQCETKVIFAFTTSGFTAEMISNMYPPQVVVALTPDREVMRRLSLFRSVYPINIKQPDSFNDMLATVNRLCREYGLAKKKDKVIITGGAPFGSTLPTNFMMYHEVVW